MRSIYLLILIFVFPIYSKESSNNSELAGLVQQIMSNTIEISCGKKPEGIFNSSQDEDHERASNMCEQDFNELRESFVGATAGDFCESIQTHFTDQIHFWISKIKNEIDTVEWDGVEKCECCKNPTRCMYKKASSFMEFLNSAGNLSFLATGAGLANQEISKICKELGVFQTALAAANVASAGNCEIKQVMCKGRHKKCRDQIKELRELIEQAQINIDQKVVEVRNYSALAPAFGPIENRKAQEQLKVCERVQDNLNSTVLKLEPQLEKLEKKLVSSQENNCDPIGKAFDRQMVASTRYGAAALASLGCEKAAGGSGDGEVEDFNMDCDDPENKYYNELACQCERGDVKGDDCCYINSSSKGCEDPCAKDPYSIECECSQPFNKGSIMCRESCLEDDTQSFCNYGGGNEGNNNHGYNPDVPEGVEPDDLASTFEPGDTRKIPNPFGDLPLPPGNQNLPLKTNAPALKGGGGPGGGSGAGGLSGGGGALGGAEEGEEEGLGPEEVLEGDELLDGSLSGYKPGGGSSFGGGGVNHSNNGRDVATQKNPYVKKLKNLLKKGKPKEKTIFEQHSEILSEYMCMRLPEEYRIEECRNYNRQREQERNKPRWKKLVDQITN